MTKRIVPCWLLAVFCLPACGGGPATQTGGGVEQTEPDYVTVQHVLIAFEGSAPGKATTRSKEDAKQLAEDIFNRARKGEDFDALVEQYSDDNVPGVYELANNGVMHDPSRLIYPRSAMARAFGDVAFSLGVGEIGLAHYNIQECPFGWHIIMRLK